MTDPINTSESIGKVEMTLFYDKASETLVVDLSEITNFMQLKKSEAVALANMILEMCKDE